MAAFLQLGMQPIQTIQAAEPVTSGDMRPALALLAECARSWHTGSLALSTRRSSLLHASSHDHSHSWDRPQPLQLGYLR
jgi:hypothetical protein